MAISSTGVGGVFCRGLRGVRKAASFRSSVLWLFGLLLALIAGRFGLAAHAAEATPSDTVVFAEQSSTPTDINTGNKKYFGWGRNYNYELGLGKDNYISYYGRPRQIPEALPLAGVDMLSIGAVHSLALVGGRVYAWGCGGPWLGVGDDETRTSPVLVPGLENIIYVLASRYWNISYAIAADGQIYTWGSNHYHLAGDPDEVGPYFYYPQRIASDLNFLLSGVREIIPGGHHILFLMGDGTVKGMGANYFGQLGIGKTEVGHYRGLKTVEGLTDVVKVVAGNYFSAALTADGRAWEWGNIPGTAYEYGVDSNIYLPSPIVIPTQASLVDVAAGTEHLVLLDKDGYVWTAGENRNGSLGIGDYERMHSFTRINNLADVKKVAAGSTSTFALLRDGSVYACGFNEDACLGTGSYITRGVPTFERVQNLAGVVELIIGSMTYAALLADTARMPLLLRDANSHKLELWEMNGAERVFAKKPPAADPLWKIVGVDDFNGDGNADFLWRHATTHKLAFWFMNGDAKLSAAEIAGPAPEWRVAAVGDFNNDNKADILFQHRTTHALAIWGMDGATRRTAGNIANNPAGLYNIIGASDFNGDGKADIVFQHRDTRQLVIWVMDGANRESSRNLTPVPPADWEAVGVADYYKDGSAGILFRNVNTHAMLIWNFRNLLVRTGFANVTATAPRAWAVQPERYDN